MRVLITGGSGYVGSRLTYYLLEKFSDLEIINYDISLFGDEHLPNDSDKYKYYKKDIRNSEDFEEVIKKHSVDVVLHLACISNDPSFELDSSLSKSINFECFEDLVKVSKVNNVKKFIYASTSSVYGISDNPRVDEEHELKPITDYNTLKAKCEPLLIKYVDNNFHGIVIRPATVCGYSEKMRFDLSVNILTNHAYINNKINIFGGEQYRPNINLNDMCRLYEMLIFKDLKKFNGEIFNAGLQNLKISEIANIVKRVVEKRKSKKVELNFTKSDDVRSYRITSDKIQNILGFNFEFSIEDAVEELCENFENGNLTDTFNTKFQNIKVLKNKLEKKEFI
ncbi:NAD-dependent epimerase/dehydratase family protein [Candidatus Pelagibacter communis]|uniref:NAD-dependent epimerase/dehydratase family protein n=1 Tax=Pelagibacter ubique TaxID=198252 RepID=UPI00094CF1F2|nr:SDR family oxidoreductase [Candidatus Pelagibacter ubique]